MKQEGTLAVGGIAGSHLPIGTRPYGSEYARIVQANVAANEGVRALKRSINDALAGKGTKPKPERVKKARATTSTARTVHRPYKLTPAQAARAAEAYANGARVADLAKEFGCGPEAVRTGIRRTGARLHVGGRPPVMSDEERARIVAEYLAGKSARAVGATHGLSRKTTTYILHEAGVMRERAEAAADARRRKP